MRFILLDRILKLEKNKAGVFLKNVTQSEDSFSLYPLGSGIMPGTFILEGFEQASSLLIGFSYDFALFPRLQQISNADFKTYVLPGDQLEFSLSLGRQDANGIRVKGEANANGKMVAEATLGFSLIEGENDKKAKAHCTRLQSLYRLLSSDPVDRARGILVFGS